MLLPSLCCLAILFTCSPLLLVPAWCLALFAIVVCARVSLVLIAVIGLIFLGGAICSVILELWVGQLTALFALLFVTAILVKELPATVVLEEAFKVRSNLLQDVPPVHRDEALREDDSNVIEVRFKLVDTFAGYRVDSLETIEVFEDDCHIEVLYVESDTLEVDCLDVPDVNYEEGLLRDCDQTILYSSPDFDSGLSRAPHEPQVFNWNVEFDCLGAFL